MRLTYIFLFLIPFFSTAQFAEKKVYNIKKVSEKPKIDGVINDLVWKKMSFADDFTQFKRPIKSLDSSTIICNAQHPTMSKTGS